MASCHRKIFSQNQNQKPSDGRGGGGGESLRCLGRLGLSADTAEDGRICLERVSPDFVLKAREADVHALSLFLLRGPPVETVLAVAGLLKEVRGRQGGYNKEQRDKREEGVKVRIYRFNF